MQIIKAAYPAPEEYRKRKVALISGEPARRTHAMLPAREGGPRPIPCLVASSPGRRADRPLLASRSRYHRAGRVRALLFSRLAQGIAELGGGRAASLMLSRLVSPAPDRVRVVARPLHFCSCSRGRPGPSPPDPISPSFSSRRATRSTGECPWRLVLPVPLRSDDRPDLLFAVVALQHHSPVLLLQQ